MVLLRWKQHSYARDPEENVHSQFAYELLFLAGAMFVSVVLGALARRFNQPRVLGGLVGGLLIGIAFNHTHFMHELRSEHGIPFITGLSEFAAMLLLFGAGLESNINKVLEDAKTGWKVAVVGVVLPVAGGFLYMLFATDVAWQVALFQGGVFAATSVGITAAVFTEIGVLDKDYARIVISAAVIDDVLGLLVLSVCQALNAPPADIAALAPEMATLIQSISTAIHTSPEQTFTALSVLKEIGIAVLFVFAVPYAGHKLAEPTITLLNKLDIESREAVVLSFMLFYAAGAVFAGLAGIVGAYFAGVAMMEHFFVAKRDGEGDEAVEHFVTDLIVAFGPVFFVFAGAIVPPEVFLDPNTVLMGMAFIAIATVGKVASGLMVSKDKLIVGVGMNPRGEVGIIFAKIGLALSILSPQLFAANMIMVLVTTIQTPPLLSWLIARKKDDSTPQPQTAAA